MLENLYKTLYNNTTEASVTLSDANHPIFKAHFPSQPLLPGFVHFEIVSALFGLEIIAIKKAKFTQMVLPNETLVYKKNKLNFTVFAHEKQVAKFSLEVRLGNTI